MDDDGSSSPDLPEGLIEAILSKSDVKSVIRSQSVSKSIASIISDPRFTRIHRLRRSQLPENQNKYLIWAKPKTKPDYGIYLIKFQAGKFTTESVFPYQSRERVIPLCSCDGLILLGADVNKHSYLLWNPSIRRSTTIRGGAAHPQPEMYDFYYDSVADDYKIVFVFEDCYSVYSCKDMIWSETRDLPCDLSIIYSGDAVDGCFYGLCGVDEIMCFDTREGTAERLRQPEGVKGLIEVTVEAISGRLCLYGMSSDLERLQMWVMEKSGRSFDCSWRKVDAMEKAELNNLCLFRPLFLSNEDEVILTENDVKHFIYNPRKKGLREIELDWIRAYYRFFPYSENLYMPCSNSNVQVEIRDVNGLGFRGYPPRPNPIGTSLGIVNWVWDRYG